jgi:predicted DsbA family dithiol-disulfide isomerase
VSESIKVDVWSDVACPWCYIGKRRFEAGVAQLRDEGGAPDVIVEYHSYELSPDTPVDFEGSEIDFLGSHKGLSADKVKGMLGQVSGIASTVGLMYDFDSLKHTNTLKAHQVLHYAKAHGRQLELAEVLFRAYFSEGGHIGKDENLADYAAQVGLDRDDVLRSLGENEYLSAVEMDKAQANAYGIQGVPFFVIDGKYGVSGAQEASTFAEVLMKVADERTAAVA